jgi:hypothetical protein
MSTCTGAPPRRKARLIAAGVIAVLVLAACGGDDDDAKAANDAISKAVKQGNITNGKDAAGDLPNPCALVTVGDAAKLFGEPAEGEGLVAGAARRLLSVRSGRRGRERPGRPLLQVHATTASSSTARTRSTTSRRSKIR